MDIDLDIGMDIGMDIDTDIHQEAVTAVETEQCLPSAIHPTALCSVSEH